jgi:hypothetical protein
MDGGNTVCLEYFGWMDGNRAVPFIGVKAASENGIDEAEVPVASLGEHLSPFARFEPTRRGRSAALALVLALA